MSCSMKFIIVHAAPNTSTSGMLICVLVCWWCTVVSFVTIHRIPSGSIVLLLFTIGPGSMAGTMIVVVSGGPLVLASSLKTQSQIWRFYTLDLSCHTYFRMSRGTWIPLNGFGSGFSVLMTGMAWWVTSIWCLLVWIQKNVVIPQPPTHFLNVLTPGYLGRRTIRGCCLVHQHFYTGGQENRLT